MIELIEKRISDLSSRLSALSVAKLSAPMPLSTAGKQGHQSLMDKYQKSIDIIDAQINVLNELKEAIEKEGLEKTISASEQYGKYARSAMDSTLEFMAAINKMTTVKRFELAKRNSLKRGLDKKLDEMHKTDCERHKAYAKQMQEKYTK